MEHQRYRKKDVSRPSAAAAVWSGLAKAVFTAALGKKNHGKTYNYRILVKVWGDFWGFQASFLVFDYRFVLLFGIFLVICGPKRLKRNLKQASKKPSKPQIKNKYVLPKDLDNFYSKKNSKTPGKKPT